MEYTDVIALYESMLNMPLALLPLAIIGGGLIGVTIGRILERKRILNEMTTLEDEETDSV